MDEIRYYWRHNNSQIGKSNPILKKNSIKWKSNCYGPSR